MAAEDAVGRHGNASVTMAGDEALYIDLEHFFFWYRDALNKRA